MKQPFKPEPIESLRARYPESVKKSYNTKAIEMGLSKRPGDQPQHIFDCEDGLRLIISRDDGQIHFSASLEPGTELYKRLEAGKLTVTGFKGRCLERYKDICQAKSLTVHFWGFSEGKGVPHWFVVKQEL